MLNIAIVDDEGKIREKLRGYIDKYFKEQDCEIKSEYRVDCFSDGINFLSAPFGLYDIVFMDIKMPMKDGLEIAREFRKNNVTACLIFVTNLSDMAIKGYEVDALDFVVKPLAYEDFKYRMAKAVRKAQSILKDSIIICYNRVPVKLSVQSIMYVETVYHKVIYHAIEGDYEEWGTMREAEKKLKEYNFSRCNSGYLVNLRYVDNVEGNIVYMGKTEIPISRNRRTAFMDDLVRYVGGL